VNLNCFGFGSLNSKGTREGTQKLKTYRFSQSSYIDQITLKFSVRITYQNELKVVFEENDKKGCLLKPVIKRVVSITRKQKVTMAVTIYVKGLSHSSKLQNYLEDYIHRSLPS
jgi:hypothetical protein